MNPSRVDSSVKPSHRARRRDAESHGAESPTGSREREIEISVADHLWAKRALDVVLAAIGLILSAPLWALIAAAIKLEDGGSVFYRHIRIGRGRKAFQVIKFRTMTEGNHQPVKGHPDGDRITKVGRWIRPYALDELPQFLNILRGEMSFVGPRPLPRRELAAEDGHPILLSRIDGWESRHQVRPGLTGFAQTQVPRDTPYRQRFRYDCFYVKKRSLLLDVGLIAKSVWISVRGKWPQVGRG